MLCLEQGSLVSSFFPGAAHRLLTQSGFPVIRLAWVAVHLLAPRGHSPSLLKDLCSWLIFSLTSILPELLVISRCRGYASNSLTSQFLDLFFHVSHPLPLPFPGPYQASPPNFAVLTLQHPDSNVPSTCPSSSSNLHFGPSVG